MPDKKILDKIINAILKVIAPEKIILFGSQARNQAGESSDYDILVIKSGIDDNLTIEQKIYRKLYDEDVEAEVDIIVVTPEILEKYKNSIGSVFKPALKEGIVIFTGS
ncbi:MAG: nucleotidyltransferase domain-containing protein [Ignavibacteriales bacterium]|nr:nucleotidyltransferase domain-containing protein [Ignavibacteriales bacterium]